MGVHGRGLNQDTIQTARNCSHFTLLQPKETDEYVAVTSSTGCKTGGAEEAETPDSDATTTPLTEVRAADGVFMHDAPVFIILQ